MTERCGLRAPSVRKWKLSKNEISRGALAMAVAASVASLPSAHGAFKTWDGGAATVSWNDVNNWAPTNTLPVVGDDGILLDNSSVGTLPASMTMSNLDMTVKTIKI